MVKFNFNYIQVSRAASGGGSQEGHDPPKSCKKNLQLLENKSTFSVCLCFEKEDNCPFKKGLILWEKSGYNCFFLKKNFKNVQKVLNGFDYLF